VSVLPADLVARRLLPDDLRDHTLADARTDPLRLDDDRVSDVSIMPRA
jgi:hypothetical protein